MTRQDVAPRRAVILGASNVMRNLATVVSTAQCAWGRPLDLYIAAGHGRSFGMWNWVLGYSLPGILQSGLWDALAAREAAPTAAIITDVGNDLLYGAAPEMILGWVEECLARLAPHCETIAMTELPLAPVARLKPRTFYALRRAMFPKSRVTFEETIANAKCLNEGVQALAKKFSAPIAAPLLEWFSFDPIHVRYRFARRAWETYLAPWRADAMTSHAPYSWRERRALQRPRVHEMRFFDREYRAAQPMLSWADGSTLSLY